MKIIKLSRNKEALVDDDDYERLNQLTWNCNSKGYAVRQSYLHNEIIKAPKGLVVDHINGNPLDNRKCNLRIATKSQNKINSKKYTGNRTSKYKGVHYNKRDNIWLARIGINRKRIYLGSFKTEKEAALAYNEAALIYHKEFAVLNDV